MKKIYTKPSLLAERFAVEDIMTETAATPLALSGVRAVFLNGTEFEGFSKFNDVQSINYSDFKAE